ncbi:MAG: VTT domain-containing protein [Parasulfuritortus sp.]|nr:VTT domain-containing protein [Parasulfuritortus sp.]
MQALIDTLSQHPALALGVMFAAALLEAAAVIGTVIPGSSLVVLGGVLVGLQVIDLWWTVLVVVTGATLGDGMSYWLGRHFHDRLLSLWPMKAYPALFARGQAYFAENGGKSVFLGRFIGPVRAIVPVVAGMSDMPVLRFMVVNFLSAVAWAGAHLLPGALFGASLQLAGAVSSRLLMLLLGVSLIVGLGAVLLRLIRHRVWPLVSRQRDRSVAWARTRTGVWPRVILSLLDPLRAESFGLLVASVLLLSGAWVFLGILQDVLSNDALVQFDRLVFTSLQHLRSAWADQLMITATELGSAPVALAVIAAVSVLLALKSCWRTLAYWLIAVGFAQGLVWVLKMTLGRARPVAMYTGADQFSFPSGHAASSIVLYGFLAFLLARNKASAIRWLIGLLAAALVGLISFSRLYLGAHWLSDVLASLSLGTTWLALLSIAYTQHVRGERLPAWSLALTAMGALVLAGAGTVATQRAADVARYAPHPAAAILLTDWRSAGWQQLPSRRTEMDGDHEEPLSVQWVGAADRIEQQLKADGWQPPPRWASRASLLWLVPSTPADQLPVLAKLHQGAAPALTFDRPLDPSQRLVIRLWRTAYSVGKVREVATPLWLGMVTREDITHPAGIITLAKTDQDFATPTKQLAQFLQTSNVVIAEKQRDGFTVLLVQ